MSSKYVRMILIGIGHMLGSICRQILLEPEIQVPIYTQASDQCEVLGEVRICQEVLSQITPLISGCCCLPQYQLQFYCGSILFCTEKLTDCLQAAMLQAMAQTLN